MGYLTRDGRYLPVRGHPAATMPNGMASMKIRGRKNIKNLANYKKGDVVRLSEVLVEIEDDVEDMTDLRVVQMTADPIEGGAQKLRDMLNPPPPDMSGTGLANKMAGK